MTKRLPPISILLACLALAACGSDEEDPGAPIPGDRVQALEEQLDSVQSRFEAGGGACADITGGDDPNTSVVDQVLASIPSRVHADVRSSLRESFDRLFQLVEQQCEEEPPETETTETVETVEPPPVTTETETVPTETVPPETQTQPPEEPQGPPETPPGQEGGGNNGNGNGNDDGGGFGPPGEGGDE